MQILTVLCSASIICFVSALPTFKTTRDAATQTDMRPAEPFNFDDFPTSSDGMGHFANMEVDGVEVQVPKKVEKRPGMKKMKPTFDSSNQDPIGVVPQLTGSIVTEAPNTSDDSSTPSESDVDYFGEVQGPVSNPAATYLEGADFEKISAPKCQMLGCTGPIPNDGSYAALSTSLDNKACSQMFVPMNGCVDNKGYPIGMLCSICCDCDNAFVSEMKKTFGYKNGMVPSSFTA